MRTENYLKQGVVSILLVFALVFSMVTISAPLASAGDWTNRPQPGGDIMSVVAGDTFTITHELAWDEAGVDGAYTVTIAWDCYDNNPDENLTFVSASATFTSGTYIGQSILAVTTLASSPSGANTRYALSVSCPADQKDNRDGDFDVDIVMGAYGVGAVAHTADPLESGDNHPILTQLGGVIVIESGLDSWTRGPITIDIIGVGVTVSIAPGSDSGWTDDVLTYTVTVTNTGEIADNFTLSVSDDLGWTTGIVPGVLELAASGSDTATLSVTVGSGVTNNVQVTATGTYASDSDNCVAIRETGPNVRVEVEPDYQEALPGEILYYTVVVTNIGTVSDNYTVVITDDAGWGLPLGLLTPTVDLFISEYIEGSSVNKALEIYNGTGATVDLSDYQIELYSNGSPTITLSQVLSGTLVNGNVYVIANAGANAAILAVADLISGTCNWNGDDGIVLRRISDSAVIDAIGEYDIDPGTQWPPSPGGGQNQTQVRKSTILQGDDNFDNTDPFTFATEWDNYAQDTFDYIGAHQTSVYENAMIVSLDPGENYEFTMCVTIPVDAIPCTVDNITVTATSEVDDQVSDSETVQGHATAAVEVDVLPIDPQWQEQHANKSLNYFVTIVNEGAALDNFEVVLTDTLGWNPTWDITLQLLPTDDTHITEGDPDAVADGGTRYNMYNGWGATYLSQRPYLKFDISEVPHGSWIKSATLWANSKYGCSLGSYPYDPTTHLVDAMSVDDDSWIESTLTWNNAPSVVDVLDTENYQSEVFIGLYHWYSWDVTDFVANEMLVNQLASIALVRQAPEDAYPSSGWFYTKDAGGDYLPYLEITYMPGVSDTVQISLDNGESVTLGFGVTIPADVIPFTTDDITVTATSQTDDTVTDSESTEAYAGSMRGVEASVTPVWQETHKDPLTYIIEIHNTGQIADMYKLTAYDKRDWPLHIEPQEIYLKPSHSAQAALSVTIPYQEPGSTVDNIWVVIQGKLASGNFSDPENSIVRVDVQAHSKEVWGVDLNVYPSIHQTGHPDSPLTWLVTVTNTGNMSDSYTLELSQNVYDANRGYDDWVGELTKYTVELGQGEEESILLNLLVTEGLRTGVQNDIDVTVVSQTDSENIHDTQQVTAQVRQQMPHVPQGEIKLQAVAGYVAIDIWPTDYDFGVLNEMEQRGTPADYFTIRNVGNVDVDVSIVGTDATSKPGEPAAKWTLGDGAIGVDMYALWWTSGGEPVDTVTKDEKELIGLLAPSGETQFDLMIQAPSTFTTPAKMWMKVAITARKIHY